MTISVIIPAYNARTTVLDAVQSVVDQSRPPAEIIVVDDGSTDGTGDMIAGRFGASVRLIRQANQGVAEARNRGIAEAGGEWLQFLDADDLLHPEKLARSFDACQSASAAVSYGPARFVAADGRTPVDIAFPPLPSGRILAEWLVGTMANGSYGVASSMFVRRDAILEAGRFEKACTPCEDWDMWIRLAARNSFAALDQPLVTYRVAAGSLSSNALNMAKGRLTVVRRARMLPEVQAVLNAKALDQLEAGRWHVFGIRLWEAGRRSEARAAFAAANRLRPALVRRIFAAMTFALPAKSTTLVERVLQMRARLSKEA